MAISVRIGHTSMDPANRRIQVLQSKGQLDTFIAQDYYSEAGKEPDYKSLYKVTTDIGSEIEQKRSNLALFYACI